MIAVAMLSMTPTGEVERVITFAAVDTTASYSVDVTGLTTSALYRAGAFFKYLRPDGLVAYGAAFTGSGTPT
jgi:hypothetical protein